MKVLLSSPQQVKKSKFSSWMDAFDGFACLGFEAPSDYEVLIEELLPSVKEA
jgi:hypothetical protein